LWRKAVEWTCCWTRERITEGECPYVSTDETDLLSSLEHRFVAKCIDCPRFSRDLERLADSGDEAAPLLHILVSEVIHQKARLNTMAGFLDNRNLEIQFLHEIGDVLQTSLGLDEVLSVALTAITAGKGFGMNRAFLLLADKERRNLRGYLGVGPRNYQEAWEIWAEIGKDDFSLKEMARHFFDTKLATERDKFRDILERLTVPLTDQGHILNRALQERKPILVQNAFNNPEVDPVLARTLDVDTFLILPLISRGRRIGVILADNFITRKPITPQDMRSMETLAIPVAFAIERASLYERLHDDLRKLTLANAKLQEQQELIIRMEKLALLGKITSSIAHSIRNPLMIIGGFARSLLKNISEDDPKKESLETIVREARQLEDALSETLGYADSIFPAMDLWDVNQLVGNVFREVRDKSGDEGIRFTLELAPDLPAIYMDYRQIAYCIKKIIRGSLDAMTPPGELRLATRLEDDCIVVEIRDSVVPSPMAEYDPVLPDGEASRSDPLGAELSFCRVILENYCKSFTVEEYEGKGRGYALRLPLSKEDSGHE
jgi:signal transduction histidine kinase